MLSADEELEIACLVTDRNQCLYRRNLKKLFPMYLQMKKELAKRNSEDWNAVKEKQIERRKNDAI